MEHITIIVHDITGCTYDVEIPLNISAAELIEGLHIGLKHNGKCPKAIWSDNPLAFLMGDRPLAEYGLREGTNIFFYEGEEQV